MSESSLHPLMNLTASRRDMDGRNRDTASVHHAQGDRYYRPYQKDFFRTFNAHLILLFQSADPGFLGKEITYF